MSTSYSSYMLRPKDAAPLKRRLKQAERIRNLKAISLTLPLLCFLVVFFILPLWSILKLSVANKEVVEILPRTVAALSKSAAGGVPDEPTFEALAFDLKASYQKGLTAKVADRLNFEIPGFRSLILTSARRLQRADAGPYKEQMLQIDQRWGQQEYWAVLRRNLSTFTEHYYLNAIDLYRDAHQNIVAKPESQRIYLPVLLRTFWVSGLVTFLCLTLGYPVAYLLATQPPKISNFLMIFVLLPFWTSLLVRTVAWVVLLQRQGLLNDMMLWLGIISHRVLLIFNRTGLLVAMTHVLLPFMVLTIYSTMKGINPQFTKAAKSLGASPVRAFLTVYVPLSMKGVGAGSLLVFILAIGYYITPELVGGPADQMISHYIALYTSELLNWGQAAALAVMLLATVLVFYIVYDRFFRIRRS